MSLSAVTTFRPRRGAAPLEPAKARERSIRRRVAITWGLLVLNTLTYFGSLIHLPSAAGKVITQGALPLALLIALTINRRVIVRPNVFLCLASLLVVEAVLTSLQPHHLGTLYRTFRFAEFVAVLWLLTPWWGRRDLLLVRCHLASMSLVLGSVLLGVLVAPGHAFGGGRLSGILWDIPPTQVAHYAAVPLGLVFILWLCGQVRGRVALLVVAVTGSMLVLTHTRTALVGVVAGILVAGLSLIMARARARRFFAAASIAISVVVITLGGFISTFLARGQGTKELTNLTGRTEVWGPLLATPRDKFQVIFGFGLSNSSFNGLPIDSNWLSSYQEQGLFGVIVCAVMLLFLLVSAYFKASGVQRALGLFLVTYCLVASFTEDGFTDATTYLLELALAASLLVPSIVDRSPA
jgi:hypothetical protein